MTRRYIVEIDKEPRGEPVPGTDIRAEFRPGGIILLHSPCGGHHLLRGGSVQALAKWLSDRADATPYERDGFMQATA